MAIAFKKPTYLETLRARNQREWRCRIHNKFTSVKFSDHRCDECKKANERRVEVVEWLRVNGGLHVAAALVITMLTGCASTTGTPHSHQLQVVCKVPACEVSVMYMKGWGEEK